MKPLKTDEVGSTIKTTSRYAFVAPGAIGAIGKGRGRGGLRSLIEKEHMPIKNLFPQSSDVVKKYIQEIETSATGKGQGEGLKKFTISSSQGMRMIHNNSIVLEKEYMQTDSPLLPSIDQFKQSTQKVETSAIGTGRRQGLKNSTMSTCQGMGTIHEKSMVLEEELHTPSKSTRSNSAMEKNPLILEKEHTQTNILVPLSTDQVMQHSQTAETIGSSNPRKVKRVRGRNKCKEVASLEVGQKLKLTFYNNRTVGTNNNLFSRHLGRIARDHNICPLGVSSWSDIKQEKLNHMWAAVEDKFESVDMNDHRDHILEWMKELWNKWRGYLYANYVKNKPIQQALKNIPKGVDTKEWEWLVKEHFTSESFQARSTRNAANLAKLKMPHHIGSKPIREIIYQKAQIKDMVQSEPSLSSIEIVEKCCGPQTRSHVFGFGGGVKAKDLKGGTSSKAELLSALRSTQEENKSLNEKQVLE
ncbi:uncharacterized protein LOC132641072 isoform X3 [Lycium barbarum]|uniref:uncharacterized protein LOC132641072 isoform X3 n=1 Tax=Lycium barbarum TaxID=112863 RepID=UPI00293E30D9|nr:uncharacterized protein LOC132641072 isoform X3 [Lycium barbarum]